MAVVPQAVKMKRSARSADRRASRFRPPKWAEDGPRRKVGRAHGVFQNFGLLVNFLEHVVLEVAFFAVAGVPVDVVYRGVDLGVIGVENVPIFGAEHALSGRPEDETLTFCVLPQGTRIAGDEKFSLGPMPTTSGLPRRAADEQIGLFRASIGDAVGSAEQIEHLAVGLDEIALIMLLDNGDGR